MARLVGGPITTTTKAEQIVLDFLFNHKGVEFTAEEIQEETGIRADLIPAIMDNLRFKGFEVCTEPRRGVHYFANNTIWSYLIGGALIAFMLIMLVFGWIQYIDSCPGCPPEDYPVEQLEK
jgi:hypothetical protein